MYDIQPWALDHLKPKGLILCFNWKHDKHHPQEFLDPAAKDIWFANQLVDDACASLAILNVLFNCPDVELGDELDAFKRETFDMSPKVVCEGLSVLTEFMTSLFKDERTGYIEFSTTTGITEFFSKVRPIPYRSSNL